MTGTLAVLVHRFGPYHLARLRAVAAERPMVAVEYSSVDPTYQWRPTSPSGSFQAHTLFASDEVRSQPVERTRARVAEVLDRIGPAAVAIPGWSARASLLGLEWCLRRDVPAVVMSESQATDERRTAPREWAKSRIVGTFSAALVGGSAHQRYLERLGMPFNCIATGYDVVDNEHFARGADAARADEAVLRSSLGLPERYFLASSRFIPKKNLERLLESYAIYRRRSGPSAWKLVLLGDGALKPSLLAQRDRMALTEDVVMPGFKQYEELPHYYGLAKAFVHASTVEQWGLVVNEAMAAGLPVVVSKRCGCVPELVRDGVNGYAFDPFDTVDLVRCLERVASDETDLAAMGLASRELVAHWTPEAFSRGMSAAVSAAKGRQAPRPTALDRLLLTGLARR